MKLSDRLDAWRKAGKRSGIEFGDMCEAARELEVENERLKAVLAEVAQLADEAPPWPVEYDDLFRILDKAGV